MAFSERGDRPEALRPAGSPTPELPLVPLDAESLTEALERTARLHPHNGVAVFDNRGRSFERHTYAEVLERARLAGAHLAGCGAARGQPVILSLGTGWDLIDLWLGCLMMGALPVNIAPAMAMGTGSAQMLRLESTAARLGSALLVGSAGVRDSAAQGEFPHLRRIARTPAEVHEAPARFQAVDATTRAAGEDTAFLQLTSGSTGVPKAVVIPHRAVLHNTVAINTGIGRPLGGPANELLDCSVSWLPLNHDMGLVGGLLYAITHGHDLWLISPKTFLARPGVWLRELGRHGPSLAPAPNFAYQTCVERVSADQLEDADLALWRSALVGAEMVQPETMRAFSERFAPAGFDARALQPCYGLAESTLALAFDTRGAGIRTRRLPQGSGEAAEVVCLGEPIIDTRIEVRAPDGRALGEGEIGQVFALGPSNFAGYYNDPQATAETLCDGWLDTGDIGFLEGGELYLTGRTKDLLIIRGQNIMPHELEWCAEAVTGGGGTVRSGAFSVQHGAEGEQAVIVAEVADPDPDRVDAMARAIRVRVGRELGLTLADVMLVRRGTLPKTTSGKVQRRELKALYLNGRLSPVGVPNPHREK